MASTKSRPWRPPLAPLPEDDDTLIRRADLPRYLLIAAQTLARWAVEGQGPRFVKVGRRLVAYRAGDLDPDHAREPIRQAELPEQRPVVDHAVVLGRDDQVGPGGHKARQPLLQWQR